MFGAVLIHHRVLTKLTCLAAAVSVLGVLGYG